MEMATIVRIKIIAEMIIDEFEENCFIDRDSFFFCVWMFRITRARGRTFSFIFFVFVWILFDRDAE